MNPLDPRRGISLIEVLISMFVLLFGLMGVAAIFPVGNHYAAQGDRYDRGGALTENAFAEIKARNLLQVDRWLYPEIPPGNLASNDRRVIQATNAAGNASQQQVGRFNVPLDLGTVEFPQNRQIVLPRTVPVAGYTSTAVQPGFVFVLDPLGEANVEIGQRTNDLNAFPYLSFNTNSPQGRTSTANFWANPSSGTRALPAGRWPIRRITLPAVPADPLVPMGRGVTAGVRNASGVAWGKNVAEEMFSLRDELAIAIPEDTDLPGRQTWTMSGNGVPMTRSFSGSYSWLATIVPTRWEALAALQPADTNHGDYLYDVSVAVVYKRVPDPTLGGERAIAAQMFPGNELVLLAADYNGQPSSRPSDIAVVDNAVKEVREGQWIAVAGVHPTTGLLLLKWYRILSMDRETGVVDAQSGGLGRRLMLDGPDWPLFADSNGDLVARDLQAILVPGVVSVATRPMKITSTKLMQP
jgi:hypothetical protein